jgi:hypothetical protein
MLQLTLDLRPHVLLKFSTIWMLMEALVHAVEVSRMGDTASAKVAVGIHLGDLADDTRCATICSYFMYDTHLWMAMLKDRSDGHSEPDSTQHHARSNDCTSKEYGGEEHVHT